MKNGYWVVPKKIHIPPTGEISAVRRGRGEKIVSDNSKCIRTSEGGRGGSLPISSVGVVWMFSGMTHLDLFKMVRLKTFPGVNATLTGNTEEMK